MSFLRVVVRCSMALTFTLLSLAGVLLVNLLFRGRKRWPRIRAVYRFWGRSCLRAFNVQVRVEGPLPETPFLLVTNHQTYLDIFVLSSLVDTTFVAKSEISGWPLVGAACRAVDTVFVDRSQRRDVVRVGRRMREVMQRGRGVVLFGEGTTSQGETVLPLRPPLLAPAAQEALPVNYGVIRYSTPEGQPPPQEVVAWWGDAALVPHVLRLARLPKIYATVAFGAEPIQDGDRKSLARQLHKAMLGQFHPVTGSE